MNKYPNANIETLWVGKNQASSITLNIKLIYMHQLNVLHGFMCK